MIWDEDRLLWLARMIGLVGMGLLVVSGVSGVVMASKWTARLVRRFPRLGGGRLFVNHRRLSLLGAALFLLHPIPMLFAPHTTGGLSLVNVLVPFTAARQTLFTALGTLAFYALVVVVVSSLLLKRLKFRRWRALHYGTYLLFALGLAHGLLISAEYKAGELLDLEEPEKVLILVMAGVAAAFPIWRIAAARRTRSEKGAGA